MRRAHCGFEVLFFRGCLVKLPQRFAREHDAFAVDQLWFDVETIMNTAVEFDLVYVVVLDKIPCSDGSS